MPKKVEIHGKISSDISGKINPATTHYTAMKELPLMPRDHARIFSAVFQIRETLF